MTDPLKPQGEFPRFFGLPAEIRQLVYREHWGYWTLCVQYDKSTDRFMISGWPDKSLMCASKALKVETEEFFLKAFDGRLKLKDVRVHRQGTPGFKSSLEIVATLGVDRLLTKVETIKLEDGATGMLGLLPWHKFPRLQSVELEQTFKSSPLAIGEISTYWPFDSKLDRNGKCQICGIFGYDEWTYVPDCIAEGRVRVTSVRRGFASGACLKAVVEHKADRGEFKERVCEDETGGWKWIMKSGGL